MFRAPKGAGLPHITTMLEDMHGTTAQIAKHLGIRESTLKTYRRTGNAPRSVMLALFWETRWGQSLAHCEAHNAAMYAAQDAKLLRVHIRRMAGVIWRLEQEREKLQPNAANSPTYLVE